MSRLLGEKISYQDALNHYVGAFILIPAMLVGTYLMFMNFKAAEELAELKVKDSADVIAQGLSLSLSKLRSSLEVVVSDADFVQGFSDPDRRSSQLERLRSIVESNEYITDIIVRTRGGVVAFPATSMQYSSTIMQRVSQRFVENNPQRARPELYLLEDLRRGIEDSAVPIPPARQLFWAVPVFTATDAAARNKSVGPVLWARVDLEKIISSANRPDWAANARYSLSASDKLLIESKTVSSSENDRIVSSTDLELQLVRAGATLPIRFSLSEYSRLFTADAHDFFKKGVLTLLAIGALMALLMKKFSALLNRPLKQLISYSQHISHGDYEEAPKELIFDEFEQLRLAMTTMADKVQKSMQQLEYFASTDFLTGLMNRRAFDETGEREFERAGRGTEPDKTLWLIILDIDHFKRVNDTAGHAVGDLVIQAVATELASISRKSDVVGRLGGEEYGILLPEATLNGVQRVADEVLQRIPELTIEGWTETGGPVTVSVGCACFAGKKDFDELYRLADEALYASKWNGRNRVSFEDDVAANDVTGDPVRAAEASSQ